MKTAILQVLTGQMKLSHTVDTFNIKPNNVYERIKKYKEFTFKDTVAERMFFSKKFPMNYGLTYKQSR